MKDRWFLRKVLFKSGNRVKTGKTSPVRTINIIKQEYAPSVKSEEITNGIKVSLTNGIFRKVSDIDKVKEWADTTIENMNRFHRLFNIKNLLPLLLQDLLRFLKMVFIGSPQMPITFI